MKITAIGLFVIASALIVFAGVSYFALTPNPDALNDSPAPTAAAFSPALALAVGLVSAIAGVLILRFGGRGYSEKTPIRPGNIRA